MEIVGQGVPLSINKSVTSFDQQQPQPQYGQQVAYVGAPSYGQPIYGHSAPPAYGQPQPSYGQTASQSIPTQPYPVYGAPSYGTPSVNTAGAPTGYNLQPTSTYGANYGSSGVPAYGSGYGGANNPYPQSGGKAIVRDDGNSGHFTPINMLNPYSSKWTIKARVTRKTELKRWSNAKGEGTLFSLDLMDNAGTEIRGTFFKEACDKFYPLIEEGRVYMFSGGKLKVVTNTQYTSIKNNYEITFDTASVITPASEDDSIKKINLNFVKIAEIGNKEVNSVIDVIGIVKSASECSEINSQKLGKSIFKRDLSIYDETNTEVRLTVWGDKAKDTSIDWANSIVAFKGVKIGDYQGKNLGTLATTSYVFKPETPEGFALHSYLMSQGADGPALVSLSGGSGDNRGVDSLEKRMPLSGIREYNLGQSDKGDYISFKATLNFVQHEKDPWYTACPTPSCNKKVVDMGSGSYRCEKCNKEFYECDYRYIVSFTVADHTGQFWMTAFNEVAEKLLGMTAKEVNMLKSEGNADEVNGVYSRALFKTYCMKARAKYEQVNDERKLKLTILKADPVDWRSESAQLIDAINKY